MGEILTAQSGYEQGAYRKGRYVISKLSAVGWKQSIRAGCWPAVGWKETPGVVMPFGTARDPQLAGNMRLRGEKKPAAGWKIARRTHVELRIGMRWAAGKLTSGSSGFPGRCGSSDPCLTRSRLEGLLTVVHAQSDATESSRPQAQRTRQCS